MYLHTCILYMYVNTHVLMCTAVVLCCMSARRGGPYGGREVKPAASSVQNGGDQWRNHHH